MRLTFHGGLLLAALIGESQAVKAKMLEPHEVVNYAQTSSWTEATLATHTEAI